MLATVPAVIIGVVAGVVGLAVVVSLVGWFCCGRKGQPGGCCVRRQQHGNQDDIGINNNNRNNEQTMTKQQQQHSNNNNATSLAEYQTTGNNNINDNHHNSNTIIGTNGDLTHTAVTIETPQQSPSPSTQQHFAVPHDNSILPVASSSNHGNPALLLPPDAGSNHGNRLETSSGLTNEPLTKALSVASLSVHSFATTTSHLLGSEERNAKNVLLGELGSLVKTEKMLQMLLLTDASKTESVSGLQTGLTFEGDKELSNVRQQLADKRSEYLRLAIRERHAQLDALVEGSQRDYNRLTVNLASVSPPVAQVLEERERFVSDVLRFILTYISDCLPRFRGRVEGMGSYFSAFSANRLPEYDYSYILDAFDLDNPGTVTAELVDAPQSRYDLAIVSPALYQDWSDCLVQGNLLDSQLLLKKFQEAVFEAVENITLPPDAEHGGFLAPDFSGVRSQNKAVSVQYLWKGEVLKIDLVPCISAPRSIHTLLINRLHVDFRRDLERTSSVGGLLSPNAPSVFKFIVGTKWQLNDGLLRRQVLRLFDSHAEMAKVKATLARIRQHLLRIRAPNLDLYYREIIEEFRATIRDSHPRVIVGYLQALAVSGEWEMFVLLARAARKEHQGVAQAVCQITRQRPHFHRSLSHSLTAFSHQDSHKDLVKVVSVILTDILIAIFMENASDFYSMNPTLFERQIIMTLMHRFEAALRPSHQSESVAQYELLKSPLLDIANPPVIVRYGAMTPRDLDQAYVELVRTVVAHVKQCN